MRGECLASNAHLGFLWTLVWTFQALSWMQSLPSPVAADAMREGASLVLERDFPTVRPLKHSRAVDAWAANLVQDNGGTILAIAGEDYVVIAADTRLSRDYSISSRNVSRLVELGGRTFIGMSGSWADMTSLKKELWYEFSKFQWQNGHMGTMAMSRTLSNKLYFHRFSPFYAQNVLAGLDDQGVGAVFVYDYIGSYQRVPMVCCGRAQKLMQPILDRISINPTQLKNKKKKCRSKPIGSDHGELDSPVLAGLSCEEAVSATKEAFLSGAEREISLGDGVEIVIVKKGVAKPIIEWMPLPIH